MKPQRGNWMIEEPVPPPGAPAPPPLPSRREFLRVYGPYALLAVGLALAVAGGATWLVTKPSPRRVEIVVPTPAPVVVQVSGAVAQPGVFELPAGSRVQDALDAAGGPAQGADVAALNLAVRLRDGERVIVAGQAGVPASDPVGIAGAPADTAGGLTDLNTASAAELDGLPEIGPTLAQAIMAYRLKNGPFQSLTELLAVDGIGPKTVDAIRPFVVQQ